MGSSGPFPNQALASILDMDTDGSTGSSFNRFFICIEDLITGGSGCLGWVDKLCAGLSACIEDDAALGAELFSDEQMCSSPLVCRDPSGTIV